MNSKILQNYNIKYTIGEGGFAQVFFAIHKATGSEVAIKIIPKKEKNADGQQLKRIHREIEILRKIKHPFVADLFEVIENENYFYLIMEYAQNGTLLNNINERGPFKEADAAIIFAQLVLVLNHLQNACNIAHRDIKPENILLDSNLNIRVIDFGLSHSPPSDHKMHAQCGSPAYASPEVILGNEYTFASDIWSAGIVLYAMVAGYLPFEDNNISKLAQKIVYKEVVYPNNISPLLKDLLQRILQKDYHNRLTIDEIMIHPWVAQQIQIIKTKIQEFKYDEEYITNSLNVLGFDAATIEKDANQGVINDGTIIYSMIKRNYLNSTFKPTIDCFPLKQSRRGSYHEMEAFPRLMMKEFIQPIKRTSLPQQPCPAVVSSKRRHCQSPIVLYTD